MKIRVIRVDLSNSSIMHVKIRVIDVDLSNRCRFE